MADLLGQTETFKLLPTHFPRGKLSSMMHPLLVTGAAGFIGARFVESCLKKGIPTLSVDKLEHFKSRTEHHSIPHAQLIDRDELFDWLTQTKPKLSGIVHLGACTNTMEYDEAFLTRVNLEYSKSIWSYATENKIPLVYASSAATYGAGELGYNDDNDENLHKKLKPLNPYGKSKLQFDLWALEQEKKGFCPPSWCGFKFFNVYGFGERHKTEMASVALHAYDQIVKNGSLKLFRSHRPDIAHGHQKRDFIFIQDVLEVLHFALKKPIQSGIFNLGTGQARSFLDLGEAVFAALKKKPNIVFIDTPEHLRERYQYFTQAEMARLQKEGYTTPFTDLNQGVQIYMEELSHSV